MKKPIRFWTLLITILVITLYPQFTITQEKQPILKVYFSPDGGATDAILNQLRSAKKTIFIQAYEITSPKIVKEIGEAHRRGVKIEILLDHTKSLAKESRAIFLFKQGLTILTDKKHHSSHNKIMILDDETVITGSYNFTKQAETNAENIVIIHDQKTAEIYTRNWKEHAEHSKPFKPNDN